MSSDGEGARRGMSFIRATILPACAAMLAMVGPTPTAAVHELHIDVGGITVRALCTDGRREVVLLHGASSTADTWLPVLERLDGRVGACAYDRRGNGQSFPPPDARGWYEFIDEVRRIHLALGFEGDYVMVGHALGGLYARLYALDRPNDLGGLVLVDPDHEDMLERVRTGIPVEEADRLARIRITANEDGVVEAEIAERLRGRYLTDIPVTVLTAAIRQDGGDWNARFINEAARQLHVSILQGVTAARHIPASRSGHDIQLDEPQLVASEILRIVRRVRSR